MNSNNSTAKVLSRILHRDEPCDYFINVSEYEMNLWKPKILKHIEKCHHPNCN